MTAASLGLNPEKGGVEHRHIVEHRGALDVVWVGERLGGDACCEQFRIGQGANGFHAIVEVLPKLMNVARPGEAPCHTDDRNFGGLHEFPFSCVWPSCGVARDQRFGETWLFRRGDGRAKLHLKTERGRRARFRVRGPVAA